MRINLIDKKYITITRTDIMSLMFESEKYDDEELLEIGNNIMNLMIDICLDTGIILNVFVMDVKNPLCQYLAKKYLEQNSNMALEFILSEEIVNALLYAITSNDSRYIELLTKIVQNREHDNYDKFKSKYGSDVIEYIRKHSFYDYISDEHEYPDDGIAYLLVENENSSGYHFERINLLNSKESVLSRSKKND